MQKRRLLKTLMAWVLAICILFSGNAWTRVVSAAEEGGEVDPDAEDITITFDYGLNQAYFVDQDSVSNDNYYTVNGTNYSKSITVKAGQGLYLPNIEGCSVPSYGDKINNRYMYGWTEGDDSNVTYYSNSGMTFYEDTTLVAHWYFEVTYDSGKDGHFYDKTTSLKKSFNEGDTIDLTPSCYSNTTSKAFVGWKAKGTNLTLTHDTAFGMDQNYELEAVYTDGYPVTFNVNITGGSITSYYESYMESGYYSSYPRKGTLITTADNTTSLTFTYPLGTDPSKADYFCYDPLDDPEYRLEQGSNQVEFSNWSTTASGSDAVSFYDLKAKSEGITLYANWKAFWTVTFDKNGVGYASQQDVRVIKGNSLSKIPYSSFNTSNKNCVGFNTKADGSGDSVDYSYVPTGNITVYAQYKDIYNIYLSGNGGYIYDPSYTNFDVYTGEEFKISADAVVIWPEEEEQLSRKVFDHWNTKEDGTGTKVGGTNTFTPTKDTTLYAIPESTPGALVTFDSGVQDDDPDDTYGTYFSFRGSGNTAKATFAYSKTKPMNSVPWIDAYVNDKTKEFAGWTTVKGDMSKIIDPSVYIPQGDITLYAAWYDLAPITFHAEGGTFDLWEEDAITCEYNKRIGQSIYPYEVSMSPFASSEGMVFVGWTEKRGSTKIIDEGKAYTVTEPMDFYAVWEKGYTITFDGNGGEVWAGHHGHGMSGDSKTASIVIKKGNPVYSDYDTTSEGVSGSNGDKMISGWSKEKNGTPVDLYEYIPAGDETLYAIWEDPCTVTFDVNGGKMDYSDKRKVLKGDTVGWLPTPTNGTKSLVGWFAADGKEFTAETIVTADITVTAQWTDETVNVEFDAGEEAKMYSNGEYLQKSYVSVAKGGSIDLTDYQPYNYDEKTTTFIGWKLKGTDGGVVKDRYFKINSYTAFEAVFAPVTYVIVTFDGNGGLVYGEKPSDTIKIKSGDSISKRIGAENSDENKVFTGWYFDRECTEFAASASGIKSLGFSTDITLYAGWKENTVKVAVAGISLAKKEVTLGVSDKSADTYDLGAVISPSDATNTKITYTSSNEKAATVSASGKVTAVAAGETTITATTADGNYTATCKITVAAVKEVDVSSLASTIENNTDKTVAEIKASVDEALADLGGAGRLSDIVENDKNMADALNDLEEAYVKKANVTVNDPSQDEENKKTVKEALGVDATASNLKVEGAGLNASPDETVNLNVDPVPDDKKQTIDENKFENAKQIDLNLTVEKTNGSKEEVTKLNAPITITLPIPKNVNTTKLFILHFYQDGTYELIRPKFKGNLMYFTVSHFSVFAIVETKESISSGSGNDNPGGGSSGNGGNDPGPTPGPTPEPTPSSGQTPVPTPEPGTTTTDTPSVDPVPTVKEGQSINEAGQTAQYKVSSLSAMTVAYTGDAAAKGKITIKSQITVDGQTYTVASIADGAFKKKNITAVTIPATISSIGKSAFESDTKLKTVTIKGTKLSSIGISAFKGCTALTKVTIPKGVKTIGKQAFENCKALSTVTISSTNLTVIPQAAFKNCPKLKKITIPKNVTKIDKEAFSGDKKLTTISIAGAKLKTVGKNAFKNVPKTAKTTVPKAKKAAYKKLLKNGGYKGKYKTK